MRFKIIAHRPNNTQDIAEFVEFDSQEEADKYAAAQDWEDIWYTAVEAKD